MVPRVSVALTTAGHEAVAFLEIRGLWWLRLVSHQVPLALQASALLLSYEANYKCTLPLYYKRTCFLSSRFRTFVFFQSLFI